MKKALSGKRQRGESLWDSERTGSALGSEQYLTHRYHTPAQHLGAITQDVHQDTLRRNREHFISVLAARLFQLAGIPDAA